MLTTHGSTVIRVAVLRQFADEQRAKAAADPMEHLRDARAALTRVLELERDAA